MSIGSTIDPVHHRPEPSSDSSERVHAPNEGGRVEPELVQATRDEVRHITRKISELSQQQISDESYFTQFLQLTTAALASEAGTVWTVAAQEDPQAIVQINPPSFAGQESRHRQTLSRAIATGQPIALGPRSTSSDQGATNPTDHLLLMVPLHLEQRVAGVVEIFQPSQRGPATQRGYLTYLVQVCEMAEQFMKNQRLRTLRAHHDWSEQLEQFLSQIHSQLGVDETAYCIVNEARRLTEVDRVSLAMGSGRHCRLRVVSGLDNVDRRAKQVRCLAGLAARVIKGREPIRLDTDCGDLPPQIEKDWDRYVDISHVRRCVVLPLFPPSPTKPTGDKRDPFGALIFEQLCEATENGQQTQQVERIGRHSSSALHNAMQHEGLFLMPLWRALGNLCEALGGRHFTKTILAIILCAATTVGLIGTETAFTIPVRGTLQPEQRRTIFAGEEGVITRVPVDHGEYVQAGQVLAELRNTDLDVEITSLAGKQTATREQILSLQRALLDDPRLDIAQQNRLNGELLQLQQLALSTERQLQLVRHKEQQLIVRANRDGQVVTWHVRDRLLHRPVQKGQALMAIVDPTSDWELELYVAARHSGHVLDAASSGDQPLPITFALTSHPGEQFEGTLKAVDHVAVDHDELGSAVRIRVAIDADQLPELKTDATVVAKVHCGQRSLGYTWFHDLIDTVQSRILFWL